MRHKLTHVTPADVEEAMRHAALPLASASRAAIGHTRITWYPGKSIYEVYGSYKGTTDTRNYDNPFDAIELYNSYVDELNRG